MHVCNKEGKRVFHTRGARGESLSTQVFHTKPNVLIDYGLVRGKRKPYRVTLLANSVMSLGRCSSGGLPFAAIQNATYVCVQTIESPGSGLLSPQKLFNLTEHGNETLCTL